MPPFIQKISENIVGHVIALVVGALFVMLLQSSARAARVEVLEKRVDELAATQKEIQKTLAEGGPAALAQRVDALSKAVELQNTKLDRLLELAATRGR